MMKSNYELRITNYEQKELSIENGQLKMKKNNFQFSIFNFQLFFLLFAFALSATMAAQNSPYINKVYDFKPAPGQFTNELPEYETGDTHADMLRKAEECIAGETKILVSLGGYGGYVVFGFDHPIVNVAGANDFKVWGNAFWADANPNPDRPRGGSCEPGIVMVSFDANGNGEPDDEWFELAGSEYHKPETVHQYQITYFKPEDDNQDVKWESNQGDEGYIYRNNFHRQPYYPQWIGENELVFEGTKLADNYVDESGDGTYFVQYAYDWGYVDNCPNNEPCSELNIEWAVDNNGNRVHLEAIHFVKVYTGVNQNCGWLGETSTEVMGAEDLHPNAVSIAAKSADNGTICILNNPVKEILTLKSEIEQTIDIYNLLGSKIMTTQVYKGVNEIDVSQLPNGVYVIVSDNGVVKFSKY
jgi:hypothetical protein